MLFTVVKRFAVAVRYFCAGAGGIRRMPEKRLSRTLSTGERSAAWMMNAAWGLEQAEEEGVRLAGVASSSAVEPDGFEGAAANDERLAAGGHQCSEVSDTMMPSWSAYR